MTSASSSDVCFDGGYLLANFVDGIHVRTREPVGLRRKPVNVRRRAEQNLSFQHSHLWTYSDGNNCPVLDARRVFIAPNALNSWGVASSSNGNMS